MDTPPRRKTRSSARSQKQLDDASRLTPTTPQPPTSISTHITLTPISFSSSSSSVPLNFQISPIPWSLRNPPTSPLQRKRAWLQSHFVELPADLARRDLSGSDPVGASLVFAQEEAGTAVCISPDGVLLTCAHCVAETPAELDLTKSHILLFSSGAVVTAHVAAWDPVRDLALLVISEAEQGCCRRPFPYLRLAASPPRSGAGLVCIGHPGSEGLETKKPGGARTGYDTLVASVGNFRGLAAGQDPQDNSEIGALAHTCWTYWGHSGAGLVNRRTGDLVGLHSSWDDETGMRRGVAWEAIDAFLAEFDGNKRGVPDGWTWCVRA